MLPDRDLGIAIVATTSSAITPVSKTLGEGVAATLLGRDAPSFGRPLGIGTTLATALTGVLLAFAVARARRLVRVQTSSRRALVRVLAIDAFVPLTVLLGVPALFSAYLDRAEQLTPIALWTLAVRGFPDIGVLVIAALVVRSTAAATSVVRSMVTTIIERNRRPHAPVREADGHIAEPRADEAASATVTGP